MISGNGDGIDENRLREITGAGGWEQMLKACAKLSPEERIHLATLILDALKVEILQPHCRLVVRDG